MQWYLQCWKKWNDFSGRARRSEYWYFVLINAVLSIFCSFFLRLIPFVGIALVGIYSVAIILPTIAVQVRRLHDTGRSGWWIFLNLLPILGGLIFFVFMVLDSEPGTNAYGPNPKGDSAPGAIAAI
jgi:uncharacterized membrane protein YhaH (DUF805 family)